MMLRHMISIDKKLKFTQGQGQEVKGICDCVNG